jgi:hypothetical protein
MASNARIAETSTATEIKVFRIEIDMTFSMTILVPSKFLLFEHPQTACG